MYGIQPIDFPWVYVIGKTPEQAMIRLAAFAADKGRDNNTDYVVKFTNEPFLIE